MKKTEFWVSNVTDLNVCLSDLAITIPARKNVNLLNSKHYSYTLEQLEASAEKGSLCKKSDKLKVRKVAPEIFITPGPHISKMPRFMAQNARTNVVVEEEVFAELNVSDESMANDMSED